MGIQIAPSILSADFTALADELRAIESADWAHVDVMDNHFVPNLTLGLPVVEALAKVSPIPIDAHLMIEDPDRWAPAYAEAGCASVTFHVEAATAPVRLARALRSAGARAGIALRPATPVEPYVDLLPEIDLLLVMTVEPGFGGQRFLDVCLPKIARARGRDRPGRCRRGLAAGRRRRRPRDHRALRCRGRGRLRRGLRRLRRGRRRAIAPCAGRCRTAGRRGRAAQSAARPVSRADGVAFGPEVTSTRAPGSVQLRTGGDSPRPDRSQRPVDLVKLQDRR